MTAVQWSITALFPSYQRVRDGVLRAAFILLLVFHAGLLASHAWDGRLSDPSTLLRWLMAVVALAGFQALRRHQIPLFWGRRAVVLWLLVLLLHCNSPVGASLIDERLATVPGSLATLVTDIVLAATIAAFALLWIVARRVSRSPARHRGWYRLAFELPGSASASFVPLLAPRPPPAA